MLARLTVTMERYGTIDAVSFQIANISAMMERPPTKLTGGSRPAISASRIHPRCFGGSSVPSIPL